MALDGRFLRRLGLSATYARSESGNSKWLDPYFGGTCFRLGYARAFAEGLTAHLEVTLISVEFSALEQCTYDELTDTIRVLWVRLVEHFGVTAEVVCDGVSHGLGAVSKAGLGEDKVYVRFHGGPAEEESYSDLLLRQSLTDERRHLCFARGSTCQARPGAE